MLQDRARSIRTCRPYKPVAGHNRSEPRTPYPRTLPLLGLFKQRYLWPANAAGRSDLRGRGSFSAADWLNVCRTGPFYVGLFAGLPSYGSPVAHPCASCNSLKANKRMGRLASNSGKCCQRQGIGDIQYSELMRGPTVPGGESASTRGKSLRVGFVRPF
jgi:hypothetical protein